MTNGKSSVSGIELSSGEAQLRPKPSITCKLTDITQVSKGLWVTFVPTQAGVQGIMMLLDGAKSKIAMHEYVIWTSWNDAQLNKPMPMKVEWNKYTAVDGVGGYTAGKHTVQFLFCEKASDEPGSDVRITEESPVFTVTITEGEEP
jgi:hypothetical protein